MPRRSTSSARAARCSSSSSAKSLTSRRRDSGLDIGAHSFRHARAGAQIVSQRAPPTRVSGAWGTPRRDERRASRSGPRTAPRELLERLVFGLLLGGEDGREGGVERLQGLLHLLLAISQVEHEF